MADAAEAIGERLADALVEQVADMGGNPEFFQGALQDVLGIVQERVALEVAASKEADTAKSYQPVTMPDGGNES